MKKINLAALVLMLTATSIILGGCVAEFNEEYEEASMELEEREGKLAEMDTPSDETPIQSGGDDLSVENGAPNVVQVHGEGTIRLQEPSGPTSSAGWIGTCYLERYSNRAGGWCDGNGPNWRYRGWVRCSNGLEYTGSWKWAGDRTKSFAYCPSGKTSVDGGLDVAYFQ
jgi:hypothetical protein